RQVERRAGERTAVVRPVGEGVVQPLLEGHLTSEGRFRLLLQPPLAGEEAEAVVDLPPSVPAPRGGGCLGDPAFQAPPRPAAPSAGGTRRPLPQPGPPRVTRGRGCRGRRPASGGARPRRRRRAAPGAPRPGGTSPRPPWPGR